LALKGLSRQHIESFDYFLNTDIKGVVAANNEVRSDFDPNFYLRYTDIYIGEPCYEENNIRVPMTPHECRIRDLTYAAPIIAEVEYLRGKTKVIGDKIELGFLPIMLGCSKCVLVGKDSA
jgi:DNA-directed RNA polymerase III subunit RPC2